MPWRVIDLCAFFSIFFFWWISLGRLKLNVNSHESREMLWRIWTIVWSVWVWVDANWTTNLTIKAEWICNEQINQIFWTKNTALGTENFKKQSEKCSVWPRCLFHDRKFRSLSARKPRMHGETCENYIRFWHLYLLSKMSDRNRSVCFLQSIYSVLWKFTQNFIGYYWREILHTGDVNNDHCSIWFVSSFSELLLLLLLGLCAALPHILQ